MKRFFLLTATILLMANFSRAGAQTAPAWPMRWVEKPAPAPDFYLRNEANTEDEVIPVPAGNAAYQLPQPAWAVVPLDYQPPLDLVRDSGAAWGGMDAGHWLKKAFLTPPPVYQAWTETVPKAFSEYTPTKVGWKVGYYSVNRPMAHFGSGAQAPADISRTLYVNKPYRFAIVAGSQTSSVGGELLIKIFNKNSGALVDQTTVSLASILNLQNPTLNRDGWTSFGQDGFQKNVVSMVGSVPVLETKIQFAASSVDWTQWGADPSLFPNAVTYPYFLTHKALSADYGFVVYLNGSHLVGGVRVHSASSSASGPLPPTHAPAYSMDFAPDPGWRTSLLTTPQFQGVAAPPAYVGKTVEEIVQQSVGSVPLPSMGIWRSVTDAIVTRNHSLVAVKKVPGSTGTQILAVSRAMKGDGEVSWMFGMDSRLPSTKNLFPFHVRLYDSNGKVVFNVENTRGGFTYRFGSRGTTVNPQQYQGVPMRIVISRGVMCFYHGYKLLYTLKNGFPEVFQLMLISGKQHIDAGRTIVSDCKWTGEFATQNLSESGLEDIGPDGANEVAFQDDQDNDGVINDQELLDGTDPNDPLSFAKGIKWEVRRNVTVPADPPDAVSGGLVSKAVSSIATGSIPLHKEGGSISFTLNNSTSTYIMGLTEVPNSAAVNVSASDFEHCLLADYSNESFDFYLSTKTGGAWGAGAPNITSAVLRIDIIDDIIRFVVNGVVVRTAPFTYNKPLWPVVAFYENQSTIAKSRIFSRGDLDQDQMPDEWETSVDGGEVELTSSRTILNDLTAFAPDGNADVDGTEGDGNAKNLDEYLMGTRPWRRFDGKMTPLALSNSSPTTAWQALGENKILKDGALFFTYNGLTANSTQAALGLNVFDAATSAADIDFSILFERDSAGTVRAFAAYQGERRNLSGSAAGVAATTAGLGTVDPGDRFGLVRTAGEVTIWKNGTPVHTFLEKEHEKVIVDSFFSANVADTVFSDVRYCTGDSDGDRMLDKWELEKLGLPEADLDDESLENLLAGFNATGDYDSDTVANRQEYWDGTNPTDPFDHLRKVVWTRLRDTEIVSNYTSYDNVTGEGVTVSPGEAGENVDMLRVTGTPAEAVNTAAADARSSVAIYGDGWFSFSFGQPDRKVAAGLTAMNDKTDITDLRYGFLSTGALRTATDTTNDGTLRLIYNGAEVATATYEGAFDPSTRLCLQIVGSEVRYYVDDTVVHAVSHDPALPVWADTSFYVTGTSTAKTTGSILNARLKSSGDIDADLMLDAWEISEEGGDLKPANNGPVTLAMLEAFKPEDDDDIVQSGNPPVVEAEDGSSNLLEFAAGSHAGTPFLGRATHVTWKKTVSGATIDTNLSKIWSTAVAGGNNFTTYASEVLDSDESFWFGFGNISSNTCVGVNTELAAMEQTGSARWMSMYGIFVSGGKAYYYNNNLGAVAPFEPSERCLLGDCVPYDPVTKTGTRFGIVRRNGKTRLWKDGVPYYTLTTSDTSRSKISVDIPPGGQISECLIVQTDNSESPEDSFPDLWELTQKGVDPRTATQALINGVNKSTTDSEYPVEQSAEVEFYRGTNPLNLASRSSAIVWTLLDDVEPAAVSGLRKTSANGWNASARSTVSIGTGNESWDEDGGGELNVKGSVTFDVSRSDKNVKFGLTSVLTTGGLGETYEFSIADDGSLTILETNVDGIVTVIDIGGYSAELSALSPPRTLFFRVDVDGNSIHFFRNGIRIHTVARSSSKPLWAKAELYHLDGSVAGYNSLGNCYIYSNTDEDADGMADAWERENITNMPDRESAAGSYWTELDTFGPAGDGDGDSALHYQEFASRTNPTSSISGKAEPITWTSTTVVNGTKKVNGNGAVWFKASQTVANQKDFAIGFSRESAANTLADMQFALRWVPIASSGGKGTVSVYSKSGTALATLGRFPMTTEMGLVRSGGVVTVWMDGAPVYVFANEESAPVFVDGYVASSTLYALPLAAKPYDAVNIVTGDSDGDSLPDEWELANGGLALASDGSTPAPGKDTDGDGRSDIDEYRQGTAPAEGNETFNLALSYATPVQWTRVAGPATSLDLSLAVGAVDKAANQSKVTVTTASARIFRVGDTVTMAFSGVVDTGAFVSGTFKVTETTTTTFSYVDGLAHTTAKSNTVVVPLSVITPGKIYSVVAAASDAQSTIPLETEGSFSFRPGQSNERFVVGLTEDNVTATEADILYGFSPEANGSLKLRQPGATPLLTGSWNYTSDSWLRLDVDEKEVRYLKDGYVIHRVERVSPSKPLWVDAWFTAGATTAPIVLAEAWLYSKADSDADGLPDGKEPRWEVTNLAPDSSKSLMTRLREYSPTADSDLQPSTAPLDGSSNRSEFVTGTNASDRLRGKAIPVTWIPAQSPVLPQGGLTATLTTAWTVDAVSEQSLIQDGSVWFRFGDASEKALGLAVADTGKALTDIDYGVKLLATGEAWAYYRNEATTRAQFLGKPAVGAAGTLFGIVRREGKVSVWVEGTRLYSFPETETAPLKVDTAFKATGSITECKVISGAGDEDADGLLDSWELAQLNDPAQSIDSFGPSGDFDNDGRTNQEELNHGTDSTSGGDEHFARTVKWIRARGLTVPTSTTGALSSSGTGQDAQSHIALEKDGVFSFRFGQNNLAAASGLNSVNAAATLADLDYAFEVTTTKDWYVIHDGKRVSPAITGKYDVNTWFRIESNGDEVRFYANNVLVHTVTRTKVVALLADVYLGATGASIGQAWIYSAEDLDADGLPDVWEKETMGTADAPLAKLTESFQPGPAVDGTDEGTQPDGDWDNDGTDNRVEFAMGTDSRQASLGQLGTVGTVIANDTPIVWTPLTTNPPTFAITGDQLQKISANVTTANSATLSANGVLIGDCSVWFRISSTGKKLVAGLKNHIGTDAAGIADVDFGIYFDASNIAHAYYRGAVAEAAAAVHLGSNVADVTLWGVVRRAGKVTLWKDGILMYSFQQREASALIVDVGFLDQGATISSCRIWRSDSDGDLLADAWEWKHFTTLAQDASDNEPHQAGETPEGRSNLDEFRDGTSPVDESSLSVPMVWNRLRLVTVDSGDSSSYQGALTATASGYDSDAQSSSPISDHGTVSFKMKAKALAAIGFNDSNKAPVLADLNYAFYPQADGNLKIIEPGVVPWSLGTYTAETWFRLEATSSYVQYFMDGIMVHECKRSDPAAKLWVDTAFSATGAGIDVCRIFAPGESAAPKSGTLTAFTWTAAGAVTPEAGTDSSASVSWSGAGQLTSGDRRILKDGGVWFKIPSSGKAILAGLNANDGATTATDVDYGVWVDANNKAWAYRNGVNAVGTSSQAAYLGTNNPGVTEYGVVRNEGRITIWGSAFDPVSSLTVYTQLFEYEESELAPLFADVSSAVSGAMISSCQIMHGRGDVDGDQMDDDWENQYFGSYVNNTSTGYGVSSQDADGDGVNNLQEFLDGTNPRDGFSRTAPLVWVRHRGTQPLGGTTGGLVKESTQVAGWNADAQSSIAIADAGSFSFRPETGSLELMAGLTFANSLSSNVDLEYYVLLKADGKAYFKHPGSTRLTSLGKYYPGTLFRLDVDADSVSCSKDGILGASGVRSSLAPLWADVSLKTVEAKLVSGRIFSAADVDADGMLDEWERGISGANWGIPVTYAMLNDWFTASSMADGNGDSFPDGDWDSDGGTNLQEFAISAKARDNGAGKGGKTSVTWIASNSSSLADSGSTLEHGTSSVYSSSAVDAVSSQTLDGDGAVWFKLGDPAVHPKMMIGLNAVDVSRKMNDIDYAVYVEGGNAWAYYRTEVTAAPSKESAAFLGKYNSSTLFGIVRVKGLVSVWKDGTPLYQFPAGETAVLKVDTAFPVAKGRVEECFFTRATAISNPAQPSGWTDQPVIWSRLRGKAVQAGPSQLSRSDLADKWNSDAQSHIAIATDEAGGRVSFKLEPSSAVAIGLTELNQGAGIASLNFGILSVPATTTAPASFKLIHEGKELASYGTFEAGTVFGLWVTEDEVRYLRDGYVFFVASRFKEDGPATNVPLWLYASVKKVAKGVPAAVLEAGIFSPQDRDADGLADIWEGYTGSGTGLVKDVDTDSDGGLNWQEFALGSLPSNPPDPRAPYSGSLVALEETANKINSAIVESKSVTSVHEIRGDGAVWFKSNGSSGTLNVGLSLIPVSGNSKSIDFGVCLTSKTKTASACYKGESSPAAEKFLGGYDSATVFGIVRRAGKVTVWKDSVPLYEFPQVESAALRILAVDSKNLINGLAVAEWLSSTLVDSDGDDLPDSWELAQTSVANLSMLGNPTDLDADDDGINDIIEFRVGSDPRNADIKPLPVLWTRHRFTAPLTSGGLRKSLNLAGWNADAQGGQRLSGSGAVYFVFGGANFSKGRAIGLNVANQDASLKDLDYAICADDGSVSIREKGVTVKTLETASPSDEFLIRLDDGVISYWQKGARIYTSPIRLDSKMLIDASLEQEGDADAGIALCYSFGAEAETGPALGGVPNAEEDWYRIDHSPELFAHPLLDSFVNDMQRNPLRIANWVLNEIELVDAVALNENGIPVEKVLNDGGVARGALGVFLERQGSPKEQCALLVYLLRRAGYPAGYIFPQTGTTHLPARTVSSLLRMQVRGTLAGSDEPSEDGQVAVNYPWVVCNLGGEWVSIYPWLKDVEIKEGLDLWDHMPQGKHLTGGTALPESQKIDSPLRWVRAYLKRQQLDAVHYADSAYDEFASKEAPLETFERKLPSYLAANPASSSLHADRFGYSHRIRKHSYARWDQLPKPGHIFETQDGAITVRRYPRVVMKLADEGALFDEVDISITGEMVPGAALTNSTVSQMQTLDSGLSRLFFSAGVPGLVVGDYLAQFDSGSAEIGGGNIRGKVVSIGAKGLSVDVEMGGTAQLQTGQPLKKVARLLKEIGPMRLADMHNRQAVIQSDASGISFKMAAYRNGISGTGNFVSSTKDPFGLAAQVVQVKDAQSGSFGVQVTLRSSRHISASSAEEPFLQVQQRQTSSQTLGHGRGDVSALCFNLGRVTQQMMRVHEENYWRAQQQKTLTEAGSREMIAYTMGMTYHQRFSESLDRIMHLFKLSPATFRAVGFGQLGYNSESGKRDLPIIDMAYSRTAVAGVWDLRPDSGGRSRMIAAEALAFISIEQSALEHLTINRFFPQEETDAISTINLLHRRAATVTNPPPYVELSLGNYQERGEVNYTVGGQTQKLKEWSPPQWKEVESAMTQGAYGDARFVQVYMTPGPQTGAASEWKGMGTLILGQGAAAALIGQSRNLNGGYGASSVGASVAPQLGSIVITPDGHLSFSNPTSAPLGSIPTIGLNLGSIPWQQIGQAIFAVQSGVLAYTPADSAGLEQWTGISGGITNGNQFAAAKTAQAENGSLGRLNFVGLEKMGADPVDTMTGAFYVDTVDLALTGSFPMEIRRNYSSLNQQDSMFGYGWMSSLMPFIVINPDNSLHAAEMDGTVLKYTPVSGQPNQWEVTWAANPELRHAPERALVHHKITKSGPANKTVYRLTTRSGSVREFIVRSFKIPGTTITRQRPYLSKYTDHAGNFYEFVYYDTDPKASEYGQVKSIRSSSGPYVLFYYNASGRITEILAGDGRRIEYRYDEYGDLVQVVRPDNSKLRYVYEHKSEADSKGVVRPISTHLITTEHFPEGRAVANEYDDKRRVIVQKSTAGKKHPNARLAPVSIHGKSQPFLHAEDAHLPVTESYDLVLTNVFDYSSQTKVDADGTANPTSGAYISGSTKMYDAYGRITTYAYECSRLVRLTDPLGITETWEYYLDTAAPGTLNFYPRSLKKRTDRRGLVTELGYDLSGNVKLTTQKGDLDGDGSEDDALTTETRYHPTLHVPVEVTTSGLGTGLASAVTKSSEISYLDPVFPRLPTKTVSRVNGTDVTMTENSYGIAGDGVTPPFARGVLLETHTGLTSDGKSKKAYTYDARGLMKSETAFSGVENVPNVITEFGYNDRAEMERTTDAAGRTTRYAYDDMGRKMWEERLDAKGVQLAWTYTYYNLNGEVEWTDGSRSNPEDYTYVRYDGMGRPVEQTSWRSQAKADGSGIEAIPGADLYAVVTNEYNLFGDVVRTTDALGHVTHMTYDNAGRLLTKELHDPAVINSGGTQAVETTEYGTKDFTFNGATYLHDGEVTTTDVMKGKTTTKFTSTGKPYSQKRPDNTTVTWTYYLDGRPKTEPKSKNIWTEFVYDDAARTVKTQSKSADEATAPMPSLSVSNSRGQVISVRDTAGYAVRTQYDLVGRPLKVTQPHLENPSANFDTLPLATIHTYDEAGVVSLVQNARGEVTRTENDALGRPVLTQIFGPAVAPATGSVLRRQTEVEYSFDHNKVTTRQGLKTDTNRMQTIAYTDTAGRTVISQAADGTYNLTKFDAAGNALENVIHGTDLPVDGLKTTMAYDRLGRVTRMTKPDGTVVRSRYVFPGAGGLRAANIMPGNSPLNTVVEYSTSDSAGRPVSSRLLEISRASQQDANPAEAANPWPAFSSAPAKRARTYTYETNTTAADEGQLRSLTLSMGGSTRTQIYEYDGWLRNKSVVISSSPGSPASSVDYVKREFAYETVQAGSVTLDSGRNLVTSLTETTNNPAAAAWPSLRSVTVSRSYDTHGRLVTETTQGTGLSGHTFANAYDEDTQRRSSLSHVTGSEVAPSADFPRYNFGWHAEGNLQKVSFTTHSGATAREFNYGFDQKGQIASRTSPWRNYTVTSRDTKGRLTGATSHVPGINGSDPVLMETVTWLPDNRQDQYTAVRAQIGVDHSLPTDVRDYGYHETSRRLLTEEDQAGTGTGHGMAYSYDASGRGILMGLQKLPVPAAPAEGFHSTVAAGGVDGFSRVTGETANDARRYVLAQGAVDPAVTQLSAQLFDQVPIRSAALDAVADTWQAPLLLRPSSIPYHLRVDAQDSSVPPFQATETSQFTLSRRAATAVTLVHDDEGQVIERSWSDGRAQSLTWDAAGRLTQVIEFKVPTSGDNELSYAYRWTVLYDGLGRRVKTVTAWGSITTSGSLSVATRAATFTPGTRPAVSEESWYDPLVEFLELAVETRVVGQTGRKVEWKIYGADANGTYGGLQGIGGLEAVYTHSSTSVTTGSWTGIIDDYYGHIIAYVDGDTATSETLHWHRTRSIGYGPAPDSPTFCMSEGASLTQATAWRGKRQDITGFYWLGARYYEPTGGRFLSTDPLGHGESMSLYDYSGGDPINFVDPTGRCKNSAQSQKPWYSQAYGFLEETTLSLQSVVNSNAHPVKKVFAGIVAFHGTVLQGQFIGASTIADQWSFNSSESLHHFTKNETGFDSQVTRSSSNIAGASLAAIGAIYTGSATVTFAGNVVKDIKMAYTMYALTGSMGAGLSTPGGNRLMQLGQNGLEMVVEAGTGYISPTSIMSGLDDFSRAAAKIPSANPYLAEGAEFSVRINPTKWQGPMAIDTLAFTSGEATMNGGIRNSKQFWNSWANEFGSTLSPENLARIQARNPRAPVVDSYWLQSFPEHSAYEGQSLIHHHLDYGPQAIPLPQKAHALQPGWGIWHP